MAMMATTKPTSTARARKWVSTSSRTRELRPIWTLTPCGSGRVPTSRELPSTGLAISIQPSRASRSSSTERSKPLHPGGWVK